MTYPACQPLTYLRAIKVHCRCSRNARYLLHELLGYADHSSGETTVSLAALADAMGLARNTLASAEAELVVTGWLEVERRGVDPETRRRRATLRRLVIPPALEEPCSKRQAQSVPLAQASQAQSVTEPGSIRAPSQAQSVTEPGSIQIRNLISSDPRDLIQRSDHVAREGSKAQIQSECTSDLAIAGPLSATAPGPKPSSFDPNQRIDESVKPKDRKPIARARPDRWAPSADHLALGGKLGFRHYRVEQEAEAFCDRADAKGERYVSWDAAFRNWLRNARKFDDAKGVPPEEPDNPLFDEPRSIPRRAPPTPEEAAQIAEVHARARKAFAANTVRPMPMLTTEEARTQLMAFEANPSDPKDVH